jgi:hypothetical protein
LDRRGGYGSGFGGKALVPSCNQSQNCPNNSRGAALCGKKEGFARFSLSAELHPSKSLSDRDCRTGTGITAF